jgi:ATP-dependent Clp protease adapter protein ClpS
MPDDAQSAVLDAPADTLAAEPPAPTHQATPKKGKPKLLPPYAVVVYNDDLHTFPYVIETFRKVFGYEEARCRQLAVEIHTRGQGIVWTGPKEVAELKRDLIRGAGPDFYAARKVEFPLRVTIEPLPE